MSLKPLQIPLALATLSIVPTWILNDGAPILGFSFWACIAGATGFAVNAAIATFRRYRVTGNVACSIRSCVSIITSLGWCVLGIVVVTVSWGHLSHMFSSGSYHPLRDPPGVAATLVLLAAGLLGFWCGLFALFFLQHPSRSCYRISQILGFTTVVALFVWSMVSYGPFAASDAQSHSVGAGVGTFLVVFALPLMVDSYMALQLVLIWSLRTLNK